MSETTINVSGAALASSDVINIRPHSRLLSGEIESGFATLMFVDGETEIDADHFEVHAEYVIFTHEGKTSVYIERHRSDFLGFAEGSLEDDDEDDFFDDDEDCLDCVLDEVQSFGPEHEVPINLVPALPVSLSDLIFGPDWRNQAAYI